MTTAETFTLDEVRAIVDHLESIDFTVAKTMPKNPHAYTLRKDWPDRDLWWRTVAAIRALGQPIQFWKRTYIQFYANGWFYWAMENDKGDTFIINRKPYWREPLEPVMYDAVAAAHYDEVYDNPEHQAENRTVAAQLRRLVRNHDRVIDIGCGTGLLLDLDILDGTPYYGIDPSPHMLDRLLAKHPGTRVLCCRAEDYYRPTQPGDLIVSLFGAASYIHPSAFERLAHPDAHLWCMYYTADGYEELTGDSTIRHKPLLPIVDTLFGKYDLVSYP